MTILLWVHKAEIPRMIIFLFTQRREEKLKPEQDPSTPNNTNFKLCIPSWANHNPINLPPTFLHLSSNYATPASQTCWHLLLPLHTYKYHIRPTITPICTTQNCHFVFHLHIPKLPSKTTSTISFRVCLDWEVHL